MCGQVETQSQCLFWDLKKAGDLPACFEKMWGIFKKKKKKGGGGGGGGGL